MNLLLDTHVILWSAAEPERLPPDIARALESDTNERWFSPISVWEILLLAEKDRIRLRPDPENGIRALLRTLPLREAVLNQEVAVQSRLVHLPHQDPADRFSRKKAITDNSKPPPLSYSLHTLTDTYHGRPTHFFYFTHGLINFTLLCLISAIFRVTTIKSWTIAVAAMRASTAGIGFPFFSATH